MVLEVHLAKVVIAVIAMPTRKCITYYTFADRLVIVIVLPLFRIRGFLLLWLRLHTAYSSKFKVEIMEVHLIHLNDYGHC